MTLSRESRYDTSKLTTIKVRKSVILKYIKCNNKGQDGKILFQVRNFHECTYYFTKYFSDLYSFF